jgi:hypothetical protein
MQQVLPLAASAESFKERKAPHFYSNRYLGHQATATLQPSCLQAFHQLDPRHRFYYLPGRLYSYWPSPTTSPTFPYQLQKSGNCQSAWPLTQAAPARRSSIMGSHIAWVTQGDKRSVHQASTPSFPYYYIFIWASSNYNAASAAATSAGPPHVSQLHALLSPTPAANTTGLRSTSLTRSIYTAHSFTLFVPQWVPLGAYCTRNRTCSLLICMLLVNSMGSRTIRAHCVHSSLRFYVLLQSLQRPWGRLKTS